MNGKVEQLGQLGPDLAGVGVERVAAHEDQVERPFAIDRGLERGGGCERVAAGERRVGDEHAVDLDVAFEAPRDRLAQRVFGRRRAERDHRDRRARTLGGELAGLAHRSPAVRVELELDAVAHEPTVGSELHLLEARDLLDQSGDAHRPTLQAREARSGRDRVATA